MKYLPSDQIWKGLGHSMPKSLEIASNSGIRIEQLEKQNETSTYVIMGCLLLLTGVAIYAMFDSNRRKMQSRMQ